MDKVEVFEYSLKNKRFAYLQDKLIEEMSELMKAILKARECGKNYSDDIGMEFADVELMMEQIKYCYTFKVGDEFPNQIEYYKQRKCDKLWSIWHDGIIPEDK
jgi:hypothetical protein